MMKNHLATLSNFLELHSSKYKKIMILGDFNVGIDEVHMKFFCEAYNLTNLIKQPTCYKNPDNPACTDLILTNVSRPFQSSCVIETRLSGFHLLALTIMRKTFKKQRPRINNYRPFKYFSNEEFRKSLIDKLTNQIYVNNGFDDGLDRFCKISIDTLNSFVPINNKFFRVNQMPFTTEELSKETMKKSRLRNNFLWRKTEETRKPYVKLRNKCVSLLKKAKKEYYQNVEEKNVTDNKRFWKTVKALLSDKLVSQQKKDLTENEKMPTFEA